MGKFDFKYEIISTLVLFIVVTLVLPALGVVEYVIWLAAIIVGVAACMLAGIKIYFHRQKMDFTDSMNKLTNNFYENAGNMVSSMFDKLFIMKEPELSYAKKVVLDASQKIENISKGIISLSESEYFDKIISEIEGMSEGGIVWAVNAFDEKRFVHDPREKQYFNRNKEAVCNRKIKINRIFIFDDMQTNMEIREERLSAIKMNCDAGICTFIVFKSKIKDMENANELCKDAVMFGETSPHLYIDYQDKLNEMRVSHGELITNDSDISRFRENFNTLMHMTISDEDKLKLLRGL